MPDGVAKDFFISYNRHDRDWAEWIAWQLQEAGYSVVLQAWDFLPGSNFVLEMDRAARDAARTIAVLSHTYVASRFTAPEWAAAFAKDPEGGSRKLIPVRVRNVDLDGMLAQIVYIDLLDLDQAAARQRLLAGIQGQLRPEIAPHFPPAVKPAGPPAVPATPSFPTHVDVPPPDGPYAPRYYVRRPEDGRALAYLKSGRPAIIQGARRCGKSWLLHHVVEAYAEHEPGTTAIQLNLGRFPSASMKTLESFLQTLLRRIGEQLPFDPAEVARAWQDPDGALLGFSGLIGGRLRTAPGPVLLAFDRGELLWGKDYAADFLGLLRAWFDDAGHLPWSRLRLLFSVSTISLLSETIDQSPLANLSIPITLTDFGEAELRDLVAQHPLDVSPAEQQAILRTIGSNPYLLRTLLYHQATSGQRCEQALDPATLYKIYEQELKDLSLRLSKRPECLLALCQVLHRPHAFLSPAVEDSLWRAGLICREGGSVRISQPLYERYLRGVLSQAYCLDMKSLMAGAMNAA